MVDEIQGSLYFGSFINAKIETPKKGGKQGEARILTLSLMNIHARLLPL